MADGSLFHASQVLSQYGVIVKKIPKNFTWDLLKKLSITLFFFLLENVDVEKTR